MEKMVHVPGYTHVGNHRPSGKGEGVSILLNNNISFKRCKDLDVFEEKVQERAQEKVKDKVQERVQEKVQRKVQGKVQDKVQ